MVIIDGAAIIIGVFMIIGVPDVCCSYVRIYAPASIYSSLPSAACGHAASMSRVADKGQHY